MRVWSSLHLYYIIATMAFSASKALAEELAPLEFGAFYLLLCNSLACIEHLAL